VIELFANAGVTRVTHRLPSGSLGVVERALAPWEDAIAQFTGEHG